MSSREQAHQLIDQLPESQISALVGFLEAIVDPVTQPYAPLLWTMRMRPNKNERRLTKPAGPWSATLARASHMPKPCAGWLSIKA